MVIDSFSDSAKCDNNHVLTCYMKSSDQTNSKMGVVYLVRVFYWNELDKLHVDKRRISLALTTNI